VRVYRNWIEAAMHQRVQQSCKVFQNRAVILLFLLNIFHLHGSLIFPSRRWEFCGPLFSYSRAVFIMMDSLVGKRVCPFLFIY